MYSDRIELLRKIEQSRNSRLLLYVTGDRPGLEVQINQEVFDYFVNHLDKIGVTEKISLYLYTRGGSTLTAWTLINLIRQYCDNLEIIVPSKCHSAGTIMCLGANNIVMTKQATLGPIDPSINTALNPQIEGAPSGARVPVSVEAIKGYIELAKDELEIKNDENITQILLALSNKIHPLVLGEAYRSRSQIQMLARKLIVNQLEDKAKIEKVISFLCSDSGSHDYTINRREAKSELELSIEKPSYNLYALIKELYDDIQAELLLTEAYDPSGMLGTESNLAYTLKRGLLESADGGSYYFVSEGELAQFDITSEHGQQRVFHDNRKFEGWKHEEV